MIAQNLVLNPGFEDNSYRFEDSIKKIPTSDYCDNWEESSGSWYGLICRQCEPIHERYYLPDHRTGYQFPRTGKACMTGLIVWVKVQKDQRGYLIGNLSKTLAKDSLYFVSFFVNVGNFDHLYQEENRKTFFAKAVSRMGAFLVKDSIMVKFNTALVQIQNDPNRFLDDTIGWMEIKGLMRAKGNEKRIYIGNFWSDAETPQKMVDGSDSIYKTWWNYTSNYFVDDVSVIQIKNPYLGKDTTLCFRSTITLKPNGDQADSLFWQDGSRAESYLVTKPGKYWVEAWHGAYNISDTIYIKPQYEVNLGADQKLCEGQSHTYTLPEDGASYEWPDGSTNHTFTVNQTGKYWVKATKFGCTAYDTAEVIFQQNLADYILPTDTFLCGSRPLKLDLQHIDADILWEDGSAGNTYTIYRPGAYILMLKNACGARQHSLNVTEKHCDCNIHIPNAFTPNADAVNDGFNIVTDCVFLQYNLSVYNRWGVQIFTTDDIAQSWDGTHKGKTCTPDVYYFTLNAVADNGESFNLRRIFQLVR